MNSILIVILILMILIYIYNDFIFPYVTSLFSFSISPSQTSTTNTQIENFSQYSSLTTKHNSLENTTQYDANWYLRDNTNSHTTGVGMPIIANTKMRLPSIRYGFYDNGSYENVIGDYFRHHIYPMYMEKLVSNLDTIYKFINNDIDIAFINEELLTRYIKKDCKYLTNFIINNLELKNYDITEQVNIDRLYPPINFSALGIGFHQDFYLIVNNYSNIINFLDITNKKIGILNDSYYYFIKLCSAYEVTLPNLSINIENNLEDLIKKFKSNTYDCIFIVTHPKNKQLLDLSLQIKLRFIHIQKQNYVEQRNKLNSMLKKKPDKFANTSPIYIPIPIPIPISSSSTINKYEPPTRNSQEKYLKTLSQDLQTENINTNFNNIIKKYFQYITPHSVDLNKFHKSGNMYSYLDTYSTRMILVIRNDIPHDKVKYITQNYIDNLAKMRDSIDRKYFQAYINNFSSLEFNYNELISFDSKIPIASGAKDVYVNEGLITYKSNLQCNI